MLKGKVIVLGIGNRLRSDDGVGPVLAARLEDKGNFTVYDCGMSPENYLEKVIREKPDSVVLIDAVDFGGKPGEFKILQPAEIKTVNFFTTHNASISLAINYLQNNLKVDIIILIIQPKSIVLGEELSPEVARALDKLEECFDGAGKTQG